MYTFSSRGELVFAAPEFEVRESGIGMPQIADRLWLRMDSIAASLFPARVRKYLTIKSVTVTVLLLFVWDVLIKLFVPMGPLPRLARTIEHVIESPLFFAPFDVGIFIAMYLVVVSKTRPEHSYLRALLYGMALAALLGEFIVLFVPWSG